MDGIALTVIDIYTGICGVVAPFLLGWVARGGSLKQLIATMGNSNAEQPRA